MRWGNTGFMWINQLLWCLWCQSYQRAKAGECTALRMLCQHSGFSLASVKPGESQMLRPSAFLLLPNGWSAGKEVRQFHQHFHDSVSNLLGTSAHRCDWQVSPVSVHHLCSQWELLGIWGNYRFMSRGLDPPSSPSLDGCWKEAVVENSHFNLVSGTYGVFGLRMLLHRTLQFEKGYSLRQWFICVCFFFLSFWDCKRKY